MQSRLPMIFILLTVVLDSMGIGLIMPVMPDLIQSLEGGDLGQAALWGGVLATIFAVMQFLFGPTIGSISDRFGRRPVLLIALVVMSFDYVLMAVAGTIWLLVIGRIIGGITAATQSTASAYMADISKPEDKAANFGLIGAAFGIGFEFPVLLVFLQLVGVLKPRQLIEGWRVAIVVIVVIAAVITPSGDPITLALLSVPLTVFYFISILIGHLGTRNRPVDA